LGDQREFYIVEASKLPQVFEKTVEAKRLLRQGKVKTIGEAVEKVGLSRSAFYKYKDSVSPFFEAGAGRIITFNSMLEDSPGTLSTILTMFARCEANILTINQSIPLNGQAVVTISARMGDSADLQELVDMVQGLKGVYHFEVLAGENNHEG